MDADNIVPGLDCSCRSHRRVNTAAHRSYNSHGLLIGMVGDWVVGESGKILAVPYYLLGHACQAGAGHHVRKHCQ